MRFVFQRVFTMVATWMREVRDEVVEPLPSLVSR
jgi:hypothetical protein